MNATEDGKHMSKDIFLKALTFYEMFQFPYIIISGGEPTDHPLFEELANEVLKRNIECMILSNGLWTLDERRDKYLDKYKFQIINDERYYPIRVPEIIHPNILIYGQVENPIYKCTRSIANKIYDDNEPKCFNIRSIAKNPNIKNFYEVINIYTFYLAKICIPIIKIDGSMILGECDLCKPFGHIDDSLTDLFNNLKNFKCNNCGCFENLDLLYRKQLDEI
jgi:hypothetical protein